MLKSPLRYPGGKSRGVKFINNFLPEYREMREVFFGGGSLSFYCAQVFPDRKYTASDLNYELYSFWQQLKEDKHGLINGVQALYNQYKSERTNGKSLFQLIVNRRNDMLTELQRGIDFYVLNRITFSGVVDSGGYSQGSFDGRFTQSSIDRLWDVAVLIEQIDFYCEDYTALVEKPGEKVFLFLDPPYYTATKSKLYGRNGILHTQFSHEALFDCLKKLKHKWLITYDNSEFIRNLYKDFNQLPWSLQYGMTNATSEKGNELLIANYDLKKMSEKNKSKIISGAY